jgi:hypothetical protein
MEKGLKKYASIFNLFSMGKSVPLISSFQFEQPGVNFAIGASALHLQAF